MNDKNNTCLVEMFDEILDKLEVPSNPKFYDSNEFFYEELNPQIAWEKNYSTIISKLALRTLIEEAYIAGKKEGYENAESLVIEWIDSHRTLRKSK